MRAKPRRDWTPAMQRMRKSRLLSDLAGCLRGELPESPDWMQIIALANDSMTTTNLAFALLTLGSEQNLPEDVREFLSTVLVRNENRNERLLAQLTEATKALGQSGIEPILMKGASLLVQQAQNGIGQRLISDIDLLVEPQDKQAALEKLAKSGYAIAEEDVNPASPVTLARQSDVGMIDLHVYPRGPRRLAQLDTLRATCRYVSVKGTRFRIPSPEFQVHHFVTHDQFHNRDYWRGHIDIRHLCDLNWIAKQDPKLNWQVLQQTFATSSDADALASQLLQAHYLLGMQLPEALAARPMARLQLRRCLAQLDVPILRFPALALTILAGPLHRNRDSIDHQMPKFARAGKKLRGAWRVITSKPVGKL